MLIMGLQWKFKGDELGRKEERKHQDLAANGPFGFWALILVPALGQGGEEGCPKLQDF